MDNKSSGTGGSKTIQGRYSGGNKSKGTSKNKKVNIKNTKKNKIQINLKIN